MFRAGCHSPLLVLGSFPLCLLHCSRRVEASGHWGRSTIPKNCLKNPAWISWTVVAVANLIPSVNCSEVMPISTSWRSGICELNQGVITNLSMSVICRWSAGMEVPHSLWFYTILLSVKLCNYFLVSLRPLPRSLPSQQSDVSGMCQKGLWLWPWDSLAYWSSDGVLFICPSLAVEQC